MSACRPAAAARSSGYSIAHSLTVIGQQAQTPARVWIGRTFSLSGLDDGGDSAVPVVADRASRPVASRGPSVGWPGQAGVVTGVNAQGIAVMVNPARTQRRPADAQRAARSRCSRASVLEHCKTLDEAIKLIEQTPTLGAALIVIVDGASGKWVVVERTPSKAIVERNPKQPAFGDVLTTNALASDPENDRARRMLPTVARVERAARLVRAPLADVAAMAAVLRDQRGHDDAPRPPGHRGVIDDGRANHIVILDPASLELWVADPHAAGRMRAFDLAPRAARRRRSPDAARRHRRRSGGRSGSRREPRAPRAPSCACARDALARGDHAARVRGVCARACARARLARGARARGA